jgi:hypothetical protein
MPVRRLILAALLACGACKGKGNVGLTSNLDQRCEQLAKACGDTDRHVEKLLDGCKQAGAPSCAGPLSALYTCYEKQLCGKGDRIWAFEDLRVLAERKNVCADESKAVTACK